jgi:hypothetical protein
MHRSLCVLTCLAGCLSPLTVSAQAERSKSVSAERADGARVARLDKTLASLSDDGAGWEALVVLSFLTGAAYTGIGVAIATDTKQEPRASFLRGVAVTESLLFGGLCFGIGANGLASWNGPSMGTARYARFRRDRGAGELSAFKLGQYEGELYRDATAAGSRRRADGFLLLAAGAAGAGLIALAATSDMRGDARFLVYLEGGTFLPFGTVAGILLLSGESAQERQWRLYRTAARPASVVRWSVHPVLTPHGFAFAAGASLQTF